MVAPLTKRFTAKWVWFSSQAIFAVLMFSLLFVKAGQGPPALAIFALLGISWTVTMIIPVHTSQLCDKCIDNR